MKYKKHNIFYPLFNRLDDQKIRVTTLPSRSKLIGKLPEIKIPEGTNELGYLKRAPYPKGLIDKIELKVEEKDLNKTIGVVRSLGFFLFSPSRYFSYYKYDEKLGIVNLIINYPKRIGKKRGKFICFVSPEGGGKTSTLSATYTLLQNFPVKKDLMTFSSFKESKIYRLFDLARKIINVYRGKILGHIVLTDRYTELTFRKNYLLKTILNIFSPSPDISFIMKADYKTLKKRRGPLCKSKKDVDDMYLSFSKMPNAKIINTKKKLEENLESVINPIIELFDYHEDEKYFNRSV